ncbi:MAG: hypothetical protein COW01_02705 [Bdellovibrionales bacterium CG12_big_fil_rev_8_21_14_0_65_38_15]|nr:MAG: hypothetical protein COW79_08370 [Bdellovibrionales bacterium CG22_combo_CG10-13_8_21_14_all_38_13]PIQ57003.1 MAG: hypothetical protein COW01_02705 [Bdellovibrionales bacterium CG12_big_fil_rev_8_21_14_0_65_38_15]PIR29036.1 MAG: hypothetical protein COV38_12415 [Bdellovibrionales bacterium CG11_big_fil_rev_8_21_14_0_20_38_13]
MKILIMALLFTVNIAAASNLQETVYSSVEAISLEQVDQLIEQKALSCVGATYCIDGRLLRCETYGVNCTYFVQPAVAVRCTGYNVWGQWVDLIGRCF